MAGKTDLRDRFWVEAGLAVATGVLTIATLLWHEWIEIVFGVDPDGGSGLLEWGIVAALTAVTLLFGLLARIEWRHARAEAVG